MIKECKEALESAIEEIEDLQAELNNLRGNAQVYKPGKLLLQATIRNKILEAELAEYALRFSQAERILELETELKKVKDELYYAQHILGYKE